MCDVLELSELSTKIGARKRNGNGPSVFIRHPECLGRSWSDAKDDLEVVL